MEKIKLHNYFECLPNEEWRYVKGFEYVYAISNKGRLASNKRQGWHILSNVNSKGDYLAVVLSYKGKKTHTRLHRLVYETFVGEIPKGKSNHIHHLNGDKQDNRVENLSFRTAKEHISIHSKENPSKNEGMIFYNKYVKTKRIIQLDIKGNILNVFANGVEASKATGVCARNILQVANKEPYNQKGNVRKQAGEFIWMFSE